METVYRVLPGSKHLRFVRVIRDVAVKHFGEHHWSDLAIELGHPDIVNNHPRLFRSMRFNDPDYPTAVFEVIQQLAEAHDWDGGAVDVDRNLSRMLDFCLGNGFDIALPDELARISNSSTLGDDGAYIVRREIRQGSRTIELKFRTRTEAAIYDVLAERRYTFMPQCSLVYFSEEYGGSRIREPDFVLFWRGWTIQVEIDGNAHDRVPAYREQQKTDPLQIEGVILRRIDATVVSNATGDAADSQRAEWASNEVDRLEAYLKRHTKSLSRSGS